MTRIRSISGYCLQLDDIGEFLVRGLQARYGGSKLRITDMRIALRHRQRGMAQQCSNDIKPRAAFSDLRGEVVPKIVKM